MTADPFVLFREWDVLNQQAIPPLRRAERGGERPRVWAAGEVADAVAVSVAYHQDGAAGDPDLQAYASGRLGPVYFSRSHIRCLPPGSRSDLFHRCDRGWAADERISRAIVMAEPRQPVDLILLRHLGGPDHLTRIGSLLRPGGRLMLVEDDDRPLRRGPRGRLGDLRAVDRHGRLYEKAAAGRGCHDPEAGPEGEGPEGEGPDREGERTTLADRQVQDELVTSHANLARSLARRFSGHGEGRQDLDQVAFLALVKAASRYDPSRNISFSTFATATVLGELKRHFRDKTWMMRVPRSVQETYLAIKDARETLSHELAASPTIQQIAERIGITDEMVLEAMEAGENYWPESLDVGLREGDAGRDVPVLDHSFDLVLEQRDLQLLLPRLAPRERVLLRRLYFDGWTQRQVAEEIGVSQMHISRLLTRTIDKLRMWASDERFAGSH